MDKKDLHLTEVRDQDAGLHQKRSSHWPTLEKRFIAEHSKCAACGSTEKLNVHHIKPFHLFPELELDEKNLITLCMEHQCHILLGHGGNFKAYNPHCVEDVEKVSHDFSLLTEVAKHARKDRLFE